MVQYFISDRHINQIDCVMVENYPIYLLYATHKYQLFAYILNIQIRRRQKNWIYHEFRTLNVTK